jgi:hypothetical protein
LKAGKTTEQKRLRSPAPLLPSPSPSV